MIQEALPCAHARERLSARLDGELEPGSPFESTLLVHLQHCGACRAHERDLATLAHAFESLRAAEPAADLWPAIARRARPRPFAPILARVAAGLLGFVGLGGAVWFVDGARQGRAPERHLLERLAASGETLPATFAALPEYRLLRALPTLAPTEGDSR